MKLLKKRSVAVVLTAAVILLMSFWGIRKAPTQLPPVKTGQWIYDGANVFSAEEELALTQGNAELLSSRGAVVAVAAVPHVRGWNLGDFCLSLAEQWDLSGQDMILVLDIGGEDYWLVQGYDLADAFTNEMATQYTRQFLESDFESRSYGAGVIQLFDALRMWYEGAAVTQPSAAGFYDGVRVGGFRFGGVLLLLVLLVFLVVALDAARYSSYRRRWHGVTPTVIYRPLIFGRPRTRRPPPPRGPRPPSGGLGGGPRPPSSGSFGGGRTGSVGGGRSGSSFGGGRTGSVGGGRSSSSFGGGRTGSVGGGRSSGSFGGGRTGSFGGGRSGGSFGGGRGGGRR